LETPNSNGKKQSDLPSHEALLQSEWATIKQLEKMLSDPELTVKEKTNVASVLAFHANTLNKLLSQNGQKDQFDEQNLGDYVRHVEPRIARHFRRDFKTWKRTLSSRRY
jgi:hypothetical protein